MLRVPFSSDGNRITPVGVFLLLLFCGAVPAFAGGLRTQIGEVVLENLQIGQSYNLLELSNLTLRVTNTSDFAVDLQMDVLRPDSVELKQESQAIPDTAWVSLSKAFFNLEPEETAESEIMLAIPNSRGHLGKKYQVMIWSHTIPGADGGTFLAYGLKSRIIFTIAAEQDTTARPSNVGSAAGRVALKPEEIYLTDVAVGEVFDVQGRAGQLLSLSNLSQEACEFTLKSMSVHSAASELTAGYEDTPDASFLIFSNEKVSVPAGGTSTVELYVNFPPNDDYRGKSYMFIIHASAGNDLVRSGVYSRLYVTTQ